VLSVSGLLVIPALFPLWSGFNSEVISAPVYPTMLRISDVRKCCRTVEREAGSLRNRTLCSGIIASFKPLSLIGRLQRCTYSSSPPTPGGYNGAHTLFPHPEVTTVHILCSLHPEVTMVHILLFPHPEVHNGAHTHHPGV